MVVSYPPFYPQQILDADGKPVAGGSILSFYAGTDVPLAMFAPDGTSLGSSVSIASDGTAVFCLKVGTPYKLVCVDADGATIWTRDKVKVSAGDGMVNPMEAPGDLIVGGPDGDPLRLAPGADGDILATAASGGIQWEAGPKKYRNVYSNVPSPNINDGYLGCLFYMTGGGAQTLDLPSAASIPNKSFIDFVFLDDTTTLTITPQGGSVLNTQATAVTVGGKSATLYRLTFLGRGDIGGVPTDQWAVGGSVLPDGKVIAATGDATRGTLNAKINPESPLKKEVETDIHGVKTLKLALELGNDEDVLTMEEDGLGNKYALWKPPSGKLKVTSADTLAGYLGAKLTAGANVTLTQQTDGDGVQTLEISATGGGGGGSGTLRQTIFRPYLFKTRSVPVSYGWIFYIVPETEYIDGFETIFSSDKTTIPSPFDCAIFEGNIRSTATKISGASTKYFRSSMSYFRVFGGTFNTPVHIDPTKGHWVYLLTGPFGGAYFAEQIYGTVTSSTDTIGSMSNAASIPNTLGTINDSDGIMPAFTLIGHNE